MVKKKKKREIARVRTQGPLMKIAKVVKPVHLKQRAKERTQEPSKNQRKGGRVLRKRRVKKRRKKKKKKDKKKNMKNRKKRLVEEGERKDCKVFCGKVERR